MINNSSAILQNRCEDIRNTIIGSEEYKSIIKQIVVIKKVILSSLNNDVQTQFKDYEILVNTLHVITENKLYRQAVKDVLFFMGF